MVLTTSIVKVFCRCNTCIIVNLQLLPFPVKLSRVEVKSCRLSRNITILICYVFFLAYKVIEKHPYLKNQPLKDYLHEWYLRGLKVLQTYSTWHISRITLNYWTACLFGISETNTKKCYFCTLIVPSKQLFKLDVITLCIISIEVNRIHAV